jgi:hypothetical protein
VAVTLEYTLLVLPLIAQSLHWLKSRGQRAAPWLARALTKVAVHLRLQHPLVRLDRALGSVVRAPLLLHVLTGVRSPSPLTQHTYAHRSATPT